MNDQDIITIEPGKRGGRPTVRGMRITVGDVLGWLAAGMSHEDNQPTYTIEQRLRDHVEAIAAFVQDEAATCWEIY